MIAGLHKHIDSDDDKQEQVDQVADYLKKRLKYASEHRDWASKFFVCEFLNLVNVVAQIFITDAFLGGEFTKYGVEVISFSSANPEDRVDPMSRVFPKMTKCIFHMFGASGTIQRMDALCVLGMNVMSEKIYIFLWFWFILLAIITAFNVAIRSLQLFCPCMRQR